MKLKQSLSLAGLLGIQAMFGGFGQTEAVGAESVMDIRGLGKKPSKQRSKVDRKKAKGHRRRYTHGAPMFRKAV